MGIFQLIENQQSEIEELRRTLLSCAGVHTRKDEGGGFSRDQLLQRVPNDGVAMEDKLVCVTSGVSFLGLAIVNRLLLRGYSVRLIVTNEEDRERVREIEVAGDKTINISIVMADFMDVQKLSEAFDGCRGVFHTAAFADPAGLSGYSKPLADIEVKASENVMEACARTPSVRSCVFTSSLLACIWRDNSPGDLPSLVNHECWSDESVCIEKKLWYALGKLRAEKAAWRIAAQRRGFKLLTICPGLITGPEFCHRNPTATIAYLKGAQEMYADGLLATVDVSRLAEAHVCLFQATNNTVVRRFICFDRVIRTEDEAEILATEAGLMQTNLRSQGSSGNLSYRFELSNREISRLMSRTMRCSDEF